MYRGLIDHLTFAYTYICKGRGRLKAEDMAAIAQGAHVVAVNAPNVLARTDMMETASDRADLAEARKIDEHIEEMYVFLNSLEIV
jgi:hypothetical protein